MKSWSTVSLCALDISKGFDKVSHYKLMLLLMDRHLPRNVIAVLLYWFNICHVCVRWNDAISDWFNIQAGVRQGGIVSPILFSIYIDVLIKRLRRIGLNVLFTTNFMDACCGG